MPLENRLMLERSLAWQFLLNYLNPGKKPHRFCIEPLLIRELVVIPQQAPMRTVPSPAHLDGLAWCEQQILPSFNKVVYVSRSRFAPCTTPDTLIGAYAGEVYFEEMLKSRGVFIMYPETMSLQNQLAIYRGQSLICRFCQHA